MTLFAHSIRIAPTHLVMDLDPPEGGDSRRSVAAARLVRQALADAGLDGAVKTSGAKGVHVFVPLAPAAAVDVAAATRAVAARAERLDPELATTAFVRDERGGKVFLDSTRAGGATVVAAYSPRARAGLPVSFPCAWDDLDRDRAARLHRAHRGRAARRGDPWQERCRRRRRSRPIWSSEGHDDPDRPGAGDARGQAASSR